MCEREKCKTPREFRVSFFRDSSRCCCYHWHSIVFWMNQATLHSHRLLLSVLSFSPVPPFYVVLRSAGSCVAFECAMNGKREHDDVSLPVGFFFLFSLTPFSICDSVSELSTSFSMLIAKSYEIQRNFLVNFIFWQINV